jgi:hypothetical protein
MVRRISPVPTPKWLKNWLGGEEAPSGASRASAVWFRRAKGIAAVATP